jgi:hypothetical protein
LPLGVLELSVFLFELVPLHVYTYMRF